MSTTNSDKATVAVDHGGILITGKPSVIGVVESMTYGENAAANAQDRQLREKGRQ